MTPEISAVLDGTSQWCTAEADSAQLLPLLPDASVDILLTDPAFSEHVHKKQRRIMQGPHRQFARQRGTRAKDLLYHGNPLAKDLGFAHLTDELRLLCGREFPRVARRWIILKSDMEGMTGEHGQHGWKTALEAGGARWVRFGIWVKEGCLPQLSGDRPAPGAEGLAIAHAKRGSRMHWNGGGRPAVWSVPIATDRNGRGEREHSAQTPPELWRQILEDFSDPGELILDPFCGSGSVGVACTLLAAAGKPRRYIGVDNGCDWGHRETVEAPCPRCRGENAPHTGRPWAERARLAIEAASRGMTMGSLSETRTGQLGLFSGHATPDAAAR